jgi:hypothetical protein
VVRSLTADLAQDPVHLLDAALRLSVDDALAVGVHGQLNTLLPFSEPETTTDKIIYNGFRLSLDTVYEPYRC